MEQYVITGMSCAACQARVEKAVSGLPGVSSCAVSLLTNSMGVEGTATPAEVIRAVEKAGYGACVKGASRPEGQGTSDSGTFSAEEEALRDRETPRLKRRLGLSLLFLVLLMYITMGHNMLGFPLPAFLDHNHMGLALTQLLLSAAVMLINHRFFTGGFRSLIHGAPNMDTLVALGSTASFVWSTVVFYRMCGVITAGADNMSLMELYHDELYFESAAMIPALITVGKLLEALSKGRTTDALKSLMSLAPKTAVVIREGAEREIPVGEVRVGELFVVRPGDSIPVDGTITAGTSAVDESALTGESIPVDKGPGDPVSAATINRSGFLRCQATRVGEDTTLAQIVHMVSDAAATKAPIARIADRVSAFFVPAVMGIALLVTIGWLLHGDGASFALARGITVLVISCPCALGLATPVAIMVGNGLGAKNGILFKTGEALETAGKTEIVALDKTGTITEGEPRVTDIIPAAGCTEEELLRKAYALEAGSEHPLAGAVVREASGRGFAPAQVDAFTALPGSGLTAVLAGRTLWGGNGSFIRTKLDGKEGLAQEDGNPREEACFACADRLSGEGKTPLLFAEDERLLGMIAVADVIRPDSERAVKELHGLGIRVVMVTGDNERTAQTIGALAGVDEVIAGVLPEGKEKVIRTLGRRGRVAMVGDGINDAPALTRADIGIAIGAGTDVAIDSADVVLMNSRLTDVPAAIRLSRAVLRNIHENLFWAFFYNLICIPLAAGITAWKMNPMVGAAAMSLSSFTVCMNALRLNLFRIHDAGGDRPLKRRGGAGLKRNGSGHEGNTEERTERRTEMEKTVKIEGMMCAHCEANVKKALEALPFVKNAAVSHEKGTAVLSLSGGFDEGAVKQAVEDKDYIYAGLAS